MVLVDALGTDLVLDTTERIFLERVPFVESLATIQRLSAHNNSNPSAEFASANDIVCPDGAPCATQN